MKCIILLFVLVATSCRFKHPAATGMEQVAKKNATLRVYIQPLGSMDTSYTAYLKNHISNFYKVDVQVLKNEALPRNAFYAARNRYIADSLLLFLQSRSGTKNEYVLGATHFDISTSKGNISNWGVMGLGFEPGKACVISTFRIKNNIKNRQHEMERFLKLALHELGHNFGLKHCTSQHCIMVDAEGKNKLDGEVGLCKSCTIYLQKKGIM
jgi:archaemetzincin